MSNVVPLVSGGRVSPIIPQSIEEIFRVATAVHKSGLAPNGMKTVEQLTVAIMHGMEIGLPPMMAIQKIAVINGRPTIWGDAIPAILLSRGFKLREWLESDVAHCEVTRPDGFTVERTFSKQEANAAGLWGKAGPWKAYPNRMLQMRARGFAARDAAADALSGLYLQEELEGGSLTVLEEQPQKRISSAQAKRDGAWDEWQAKVDACTSEHDISVLEAEWEQAGMPERWNDPFLDLIEVQRLSIKAAELPAEEDPQ